METSEATRSIQLTELEFYQVCAAQGRVAGATLAVVTAQRQCEHALAARDEAKAKLLGVLQALARTHDGLDVDGDYDADDKTFTLRRR